MIGSSRAATQSLAKTTKVYRNRGVDIGSFNILIRLRTVQIGFYRVHLPLGSMPEKTRSKKSFLSWRTVGMIIGPKKVEKSREISKFYRDLRNSLYKRYKGSSSNPYRILGFPKKYKLFSPDDQLDRSP